MAESTSILSPTTVLSSFISLTTFPSSVALASSTITSVSSDLLTASSTSTAVSIISQLPRIIQPNGGVPDAPAGSTLVQLGWGRSLNYPFVVANPAAVQQFLDLVPGAVAYGLNISTSDVVLQFLQPYNTLSTLGYITTLMMLFIPSQQVSVLSLAILNPSSSLFNNPDVRTQKLMALIDSSLPLLAGNTDGSGGSEIITDTAMLSTVPTTTATSRSVGPGATATGSGSSSTVEHSTAFPGWGIAVLVIGLLLLLMGVGVLLWYRRKNKARRRTPAMSDTTAQHQPVREIDHRTYSFSPRTELPGSLGNMSAPPDAAAKAGALLRKQELETRHNRHELEASYNARNHI